LLLWGEKGKKAWRGSLGGYNELKGEIVFWERVSVEDENWKVGSCLAEKEEADSRSQKIARLWEKAPSTLNTGGRPQKKSLW